MAVLPVPVILTVCAEVDQEALGQPPALVRVVDSLEPDFLPGFAPPFFIYVPLGDGYGLTDLTVTVSEWGTVVNEVFRGSTRVAFTNRLQVFHLCLLIEECPIPRPGSYDIALLAGDDCLARRSIRVILPEEQE